MDAQAKLAELIGSSFGRWFKNATFTDEGVVLDSAFKMDYVRQHFDTQLTQAFGFCPKVTVQEKKALVSSPPEAVIASAEIIPLEKARKPKTGFSARELILLNLPHSDPKDSPVWTRRNGNISLIVQGGYKMDAATGKAEPIGIPYGATARLILFYLMTEATLSKKRRIYLGNSFNAFLDSIGAAKDRRGKKTGAAAVIRQLDRLVNSSFKIQQNLDAHEFEIIRCKLLPFVDEYELWFSKKQRQQSTLWSSYIELSKELFDSLQKSPIPLDWDILLKLRKSPLAIDLYAWLTYEAARAQKTGTGRFIPWAALKEQMGAEYSRLDNFVTAAKRELSRIRKIYSGLSLGKSRAGIEIMADSLPSVERKGLPGKDPSREK